MKLGIIQDAFIANALYDYYVEYQDMRGFNKIKDRFASINLQGYATVFYFNILNL